MNDRVKGAMGDSEKRVICIVSQHLDKGYSRGYIQ